MTALECLKGESLKLIEFIEVSKQQLKHKAAVFLCHPDYGTRPAVLPPSRSDLIVFKNLFVTVFAVFWLILWVFYLLFLLFPGEMLQIRITDSRKHLVYHALLSARERHHFRPPWRFCSMGENGCKLWFLTKSRLWYTFLCIIAWWDTF